jgi:hypothetical protein
MGEVRNAYKIFIRKPEGRRPHRRPRCRLEGNIRMDLMESCWEGADRVHLAQDRDHRL